jgi:hypothetical protein
VLLVLVLLLVVTVAGIFGVLHIFEQGWDIRELFKGAILRAGLVSRPLVCKLAPINLLSL